jgi:hypothetical protein
VNPSLEARARHPWRATPGSTGITPAAAPFGVAEARRLGPVWLFLLAVAV